MCGCKSSSGKGRGRSKHIRGKPKPVEEKPIIEEKLSNSTFVEGQEEKLSKKES